MKVKRKGAYQYQELGWHQDQGGLVIPKAAEAYMLHGTPVEQFIFGHKDEFDFMLRIKVPRSSSLVLCNYEQTDEGTKMIDIEPQQNVCRYYPATSGKSLVKIMPPGEGKEEDREFGINSEYKIKTCNNMDHFSWDDLDYNYYINEAKKLIIE